MTAKPRQPLYLDYQATTPVDPEVLKRMLPYFTERFGNASSRAHEYGWTAEAAVEAAREHVAGLIGCASHEVVFTSGATESNNLALFGVAETWLGEGRTPHFVTTRVEHRSVLGPLEELERRGSRVTYLPVDRDGRVTAEAVREALTPDTALVTIMFANNEVGTVQPLAEIGRLCKEAGVLFHTDAAQAGAYFEFDALDLGVDLLTLSAHKMYGPKGAGALYVRRRNPRVRLKPLFYGGGQERELRSGTLNVPAIVGMGEAARLAVERRSAESARVSGLRDQLWKLIRQGLGQDVKLNGAAEGRLPGNLSVRVLGIPAEAFILEARDLAVGSGSACASGTGKPSHVLRQLGLSEEDARSTVRIGIGRFTTAEEVEYAAARFVEVVRKLKAMAPAGFSGRGDGDGESDLRTEGVRS